MVSIVLKYSGKIFVCALGLTGGTLLGGMVSAGLGLRGPQMPPGVDLRLLGLLSLAGGVAVAVGLAAAWLAFPVVYFIFGMPVGLVVEKAYRDQAFGLRLPSLEVIVLLQLVRGLLLLLAALPILAGWSDSRRRFWLTFGFVLFVLLGLYGLIQAYWLPWEMRGLHMLEILLDSLLYAWLLAALLLPRTQRRLEPAPPAAA